MNNNEENDDNDDYLTDVGFMFDSYHSRDKIKINFVDLCSISINCIDEEPGHVQSGQHLWPGATLLSNYCKFKFNCVLYIVFN